MIKTKIMFGALAALFLSVGIFAATNLQEKERVSDLTLANIEAMTQVDEGIDDQAAKWTMTLDKSRQLGYIWDSQSKTYVMTYGTNCTSGGADICLDRGI